MAPTQPGETDAPDDGRDRRRNEEPSSEPAGECPGDASGEAPVSLTGHGPRPGQTRPPPSRPGDAAGPPSILQTLAERTGIDAHVSLRDEDSGRAGEPVVASGSSPGDQAPQVAAGQAAYQLLGEIARGGMGAVYKGRDADLGRDVALKVLLEKHADNPTIVQRFVEEAQIGGQLQHPGIVPVYGLGLMDDERPYFTMKLVKGRTLGALLADRTTVADDRHRFLTIFEQLCQTIAYAHARRVIHRDLKPANIMVGAFGEVQVVDWGLAKVLQEGGVHDEQAELHESPPQVSLIETVRSGSGSGGSESMAGSVMGTPSYMSPEQAHGDLDRVDERTDVFALGSILCQILTGRPVYAGEDVLDQASEADQEDARRRLDASDADEGLLDLVRRCVAPSRRQRPRDGQALVDEVQAYLAGREERGRRAQIEAAEARVRAEDERKARRLTLALAAAVLVIAVGGGGTWLFLETKTARLRETTTSEVSALLAEAGRSRGEGDLAGALAFAASARTYLSDREEASPELVRQVEDTVDTLEAALATEERLAAEDERLASFLTALDRVQYSALATSPRADHQMLRERFYRAVFAAYRLDPFAEDTTETEDAIVATGHAERVALALDDWSRTARLRFGWRSPEHLALTDLAQAVDDDAVRGRLREALLDEDRGTLRALATSKSALDWPPETVLMFAGATADIGFPVDVLPLLRACHARHRTNAHVSLTLAQRLLDEEQWTEAARYLAASLAAEPHLALAEFFMAQAEAELGNTQEAADLAVHVLEDHPEATWAAEIAGPYVNPLMRSDDRANTLRVLEGVVAVTPDNHDIKRFLAGRLCNGPPEVRDAGRAYRIATEALQDEARMLPREASFYWWVVAACEYWNGRDQAALAALDRYDDLFLPDTDSGSWLMRSILYARGGRRDEGEPFWRRAEERHAGRAPEDERLDPVFLELRAEARRLYRD